MTQRMTKTEFLEQLKSSRDELELIINQIDPAQMTQVDAVGAWSVKDVLSHIVWHEQEMIGVLRERALVGSELWNHPLDERNQVIFEMYRLRPLDEVLAEFEQVFPQLWELIQTISEDELNDPSRFHEMPAEWLPWKLIAENTYEHYDAHLPELRAVLEAQG